MKFSPLILEEQGKQGFTHRLDFSFRDIPAGIAVNTAWVKDVAVIPNGSIVYNAFLLLVTPFQDLSDAAFNTSTLSVGDAASATRYLNAVETNLNGTEVLNSFTSAVNFIYTAAGVLRLTLNAMAAKTVSDLDKGQAIVLLTIGNENRAAIIDNAQP
jgi:hypothetical protein